jgi:hypothetical protein
VLLKECLMQAPHRFNKVVEIDAAADHLQMSIISSYEASCPLKTPRDSYKLPLWSAELEGLRKETKKAL